MNNPYIFFAPGCDMYSLCTSYKITELFNNAVCDNICESVWSAGFAVCPRTLVMDEEMNQQPTTRYLVTITHFLSPNL